MGHVTGWRLRNCDVQMFNCAKKKIKLSFSHVLEHFENFEWAEARKYFRNPKKKKLPSKDAHYPVEKRSSM